MNKLLQKFYGLKPIFKATIIFLAIVALCVGLAVAASTYITSEHITHPDPLTPVSTATPTPTTTTTPTPTAPIIPTVVTLTANDSDIHYGDKLTFTAQLDVALAGVEITYYNNSTSYATYYTDALGAVTFTRGPFTGAYDCYVTAKTS